jgi:hypothetical protein
VWHEELIELVTEGRRTFNTLHAARSSRVRVRPNPAKLPAPNLDLSGERQPSRDSLATLEGA